MNYLDSIVTMESQQPVIQRSPGKRFVHSLEYEMIANLAIKQYSCGEEAAFDKLLSIPLTERIPGIINEYGLKRAHRLIKTILQEFTWSVPLPKSAKLTETKISAVACDLILAAYEDQLAIEDFIVFFERAKKGKYGKFKGTVTHFSIMEKLNQYRTERTAVYQSLKAEQEAQVKRMSDIPRIGDTKSIGEILQGADVINMTKRMSG
ncbi:MAG: hypothetical protein JWR72_2614 [Flavisolibacter sp.]|jgi:hypothetical protein|nr:hypothetical protein [Flavisolibacter sp.]